MKFTNRELDLIVMLSTTEKPRKYIKKYLEELIKSPERVGRRVAFFNKNYRSFFTHYFSSFAGKHIEDCIMEAYTAALPLVQEGEDLDIALQAGLRAGSKLYYLNTKETPLEYIEEFDDEYI